MIKQRSPHQASRKCHEDAYTKGMPFLWEQHALDVRITNLLLRYSYLSSTIFREKVLGPTWSLRK